MTIQETMQVMTDNIHKAIERQGYFKTTSCDAPNWPVQEHVALLKLHANPPDGLNVTYTIGFGVHDWLIYSTK